jgi:hypothetical protein
MGQAQLRDPLGNAAKAPQESYLVQITRILFAAGSMWGVCWEVCSKDSAILKLSGEKGQGMLAGRVVGNLVFLLNRSRNEGTSWGPSGEKDQSVLNGPWDGLKLSHACVRLLKSRSAQSHLSPFRTSSWAGCVLGFWCFSLYKLHVYSSMWSEAEVLSAYGVVPE